MIKRLINFILCLLPSLCPQGTIILLNGTSSAGKTSIAKELQKIWGDSCEFEKEKEFDNFLYTLLEDLSLNNHETVQITPRYTYDLIINSATQNPAACAQQIHGFIQKKQKHTAFQKSYVKVVK